MSQPAPSIKFRLEYFHPESKTWRAAAAQKSELEKLLQLLKGFLATHIDNLRPREYRILRVDSIRKQVILYTSISPKLPPGHEL